MNKYIIFTPIYKANSGGIIVLHKLCAMLRDLGCEATIWPSRKPILRELVTLKGLQRHRRWYTKVLPRHLMGKEDIKSPYNLPVAGNADIRNAIVIYPEVIKGNPLRAEKVVRWLLNKPGALSRKVKFDDGDLIFYFDEQFNDWELNPDRRRHLHLLELMTDVYTMSNTGERHGTCYMVRKGENRKLDQHDDSAMKVDGLDHRQMAAIFNRCKYFVSYDVYTLYSRYAAMCGCIPVVIPEPGVTKEMWAPKPENRYGIAYGWDDIIWAIETRQQMMQQLEESEREAEESVKNFVEICNEYFGDDV